MSVVSKASEVNRTVDFASYEGARSCWNRRVNVIQFGIKTKVAVVCTPQI